MMADPGQDEARERDVDDFTHYFEATGRLSGELAAALARADASEARLSALTEALTEALPTLRYAEQIVRSNARANQAPETRALIEAHADRLYALALSVKESER